MRDHLAHRYFDTAHAILQATVDEDLPELERAVREMAETLPEEDQPVQDDSARHTQRGRAAKLRTASESDTSDMTLGSTLMPMGGYGHERGVMGFRQLGRRSRRG